jgi:thiosulfate/3-mercaptopyruvate sulfurtransferase
MLPRPEVFASRVRKLGIGDGSRIVVYDNQGIFTGPRVWWTFRVMGHDDVFILDGGFPAWERGGYPIEDGPPPKPPERHFTARMRSDLVRSIEDVRKRIDAGAPILDARPALRFRGEAPEPRAGLRGGHMPGALSVPFATLINESGELRPSAELRDIFAAAKVGVQQSAVCSCGSGITAAVIALALARLGKWDAAVYDGSWTEWGGREDTPIVTGA